MAWPYLPEGRGLARVAMPLRFRQVGVPCTLRKVRPLAFVRRRWLGPDNALARRFVAVLGATVMLGAPLSLFTPVSPRMRSLCARWCAPLAYRHLANVASPSFAPLRALPVLPVLAPAGLSSRG